MWQRYGRPNLLEDQRAPEGRPELSNTLASWTNNRVAANSPVYRPRRQGTPLEWARTTTLHTPRTVQGHTRRCSTTIMAASFTIMDPTHMPWIQRRTVYETFNQYPAAWRTQDTLHATERWQAAQPNPQALNVRSTRERQACSVLQLQNSNGRWDNGYSEHTDLGTEIRSWARTKIREQGGGSSTGQGERYASWNEDQGVQQH